MAYGEDFFSTLENKEACGKSKPSAMWRNVKRRSLLWDEANCSDKHQKLHLGSGKLSRRQISPSVQRKFRFAT